MIERLTLFIGGQWTETAGHEKIRVASPHYLPVVGGLPLACETDADAALTAARAAVDGGWTAATPAERAQRIRALSSILQARSLELAELITEEMGSPSKFSLVGQVLAAT